MRPIFSLILVWLLICGCQATGPAKIDNPVVGPPPPRLPPEQIRRNQEAYAGRVSSDQDEENGAIASVGEKSLTTGNIERVSLESIDLQNPPAFEDGMVVAMVNDQPIFAGDVLAPAAGEVKAAEAKLKQHFGKEYKPEVLNRVRASLIQRDIGRAIQRKILVQSARAEFKKEQLAAMNKSIEKDWEEHLQELMKQNQVTSEAEVAELFASNNFNLGDHKSAYFDEQIAMNYVSYKAHSRFEPTRKEMLKYYEDHLEEYEFPSRVHWQQLVISFDDQGGKAGAKKHLDKTVQELVNGADFTAIIKKCGSGPKSATGGIWDWTVKGSLANKELEEELFTLPIGEMSGVIETASGYQIVVVLDREEAGRKSFESLQKEIESKLKSEAFQVKAKEVLESTRTSSTIITVFDPPEDRKKKVAAARPKSVDQRTTTRTRIASGGLLQTQSDTGRSEPATNDDTESATAVPEFEESNPFEPVSGKLEAPTPSQRRARAAGTSPNPLPPSRSGTARF